MGLWPWLGLGLGTQGLGKIGYRLKTARLKIKARIIPKIRAGFGSRPGLGLTPGIKVRVNLCSRPGLRLRLVI